MKLIFFCLSLVLWVFAANANDLLKNDTKLSDNRHGAPLSFQMSSGILQLEETGKKLAEHLNDKSPEMGVLDLLALEHQRDQTAQTKVRSTKFTFLKAVNHNCEGDRYAYSSIIEVKQTIQANSGKKQVFIEKREEKIARFYDALAKKYPDLTFSVSIECVQGFFETIEEAKDALEKSSAQQKNVSLINL